MIQIKKQHEFIMLLTLLVAQKRLTFLVGMVLNTLCLGIFLPTVIAAEEKARLQKQDGKFYLILWLEKAGYNVDTKKWLEVPSQKVTLTLNTDISEATIYVPNDSSSFKSSQTYPKQLDIDVPDHPVVVELAGN